MWGSLQETRVEPLMEGAGCVRMDEWHWQCEHMEVFLSGCEADPVDLYQQYDGMGGCCADGCEDKPTATCVEGNQQVALGL